MLLLKIQLNLYHNLLEQRIKYLDMHLILNNNHHYSTFREERISQYFNKIVDLERLAMTLAIYAEDVYYTQKIIRTINELEAYDRD